MNSVLGKKFDKIEDKILTGSYHEALQDIESIEQRNETSFRDRVICKRLKTQLYGIFQQFSQAVEFGKYALEESIELDDKLLIFDSAFHYGRALCLTGNIKVGLEKLDLAEKILENLSDKKSPEFLKRKVLLLVYYKGWRDGFDYLLERLEQASNISEEIDYNYGRVSVLGEIASLYYWYGDYYNAIKYYKICLELAEKFCFHENIMGCMGSIGGIQLYKGELEKSLELFLKTLPFAEKMESAFAQSFILGSIGFIYWQKQDLNNATKYYEKCIKDLRESKNTEHRQYVWMLFRLILVLMEQKKYAEAKEKLEIIKSVSDLQSYRQRHLSHKIFKLSKAIVLKQLSLEGNLEEITDLLEEVAYDELIHDELNKTALFHLCDLNLRKLVETNNFEFLDTIKLKVKDLRKMAKEQDSFLILTETLLFESQLSLLELDTNQAKLYLQDAQKIAEEKGIHRLANFISDAYDNLLDNLERWENATSLLPDIVERLELTNIDELLQKFLRSKIVYTDIVQEKELPVSFILLNHDKSILFSENFSDTALDITKVEDLLVRIQNQMDKNEDRSSYFERIRLNGYTVVLQKQEPLVFCYVFIGKSYLTLNKFQKLLDDLKISEGIWQRLLSKFQKQEPLLLDDRIELSNYLIDIFC